MPFISEAQIARIQNAYASAKASGRRTLEIAKEKELLQFAETLGGAALMGFVRGKMEADDGTWQIGPIPVDAELLIGGTIAAAAIAGKMSSKFDVLGKYNSDALAISSGILAHYTGQLARKYGKTGTFSMVAGGADLISGSASSLIGQGSRIPMNDVLRSALAASS